MSYKGKTGVLGTSDRGSIPLTPTMSNWPEMTDFITRLASVERWIVHSNDVLTIDYTINKIVIFREITYEWGPQFSVNFSADYTFSLPRLSESMYITHVVTKEEEELYTQSRNRRYILDAYAYGLQRNL